MRGVVDCIYSKPVEPVSPVTNIFVTEPPSAMRMMMRNEMPGAEGGSKEPNGDIGYEHLAHNVYDEVVPELPPPRPVQDDISPVLLVPENLKAQVTPTKSADNTDYLQVTDRLSSMN